MPIVSEQRRRLGWGIGFTALSATISAALWGRGAIVPAAVFGGVATALQLIAAHVTIREGKTASVDRLPTYLLGMALRFGGVVILAVAMLIDEKTFAPLPSAVGYLGTVLPLLYLETRLAR